ncbi:hypothetical protein TNCV_1978981 [Trichonephila clavipes]|nr:hypothetical protein TNCV_1978981 [Trichonephila clavipes]
MLSTSHHDQVKRTTPKLSLPHHANLTPLTASIDITCISYTTVLMTPGIEPTTKQKEHRLRVHEHDHLASTITKHAFSPFINFGTANREVTHPVPPTNHRARYPPTVHRKLPWFLPQTIASSLLLLPATTSVTTILQPANQVASCSPSRIQPLPQATFTVQLWDGGTLRVPCPNK